MNKKYKVAILGVGHIAENFHIPAWIQNNKCKIVAICDKNNKQLSYIAKKFKIKKLYKTYKKMIKDVEFDIINICTPPYLHFKNLALSIKHKKNIFVEKPFVVKVNEFDKVKNNLKKQVYLQCALHQRYRPISNVIRKEIQKKSIGKIYYINVIHRKFRSIPRHSKVFSRKKLSGGGPLIDLGTHYFDLVSWIINFPKIKKVSCEIKREIFKNSMLSKYLPYKNYNNEEICFGNIKFANNIYLNFEIGYVLNTNDEKIKIEFFGTKGNIVWPENNYFVLKNNTLNKKTFIYKDYKASFLQINAFIENIKKKNKLIKNLKEYRYIVNLIDMLYKSSKS